jgi:hypothetical protein
MMILFHYITRCEYHKCLIHEFQIPSHIFFFGVCGIDNVRVDGGKIKIKFSSHTFRGKLKESREIWRD